MPLSLTLLLLIAALALAGFANWQERRVRRLEDTPLISYPMIQIAAVVVALLMAAHLISLLTGQQLQARRMM